MAAAEKPAAVRRAEELVEREMGGRDASHDAAHALRVRDLALSLAAEEGLSAPDRLLTVTNHWLASPSFLLIVQSRRGEFPGFLMHMPFGCSRWNWPLSCTTPNYPLGLVWMCHVC